MEFVQVQKSWVTLQNCTHPGKDEGGVFAVSTPHSQLAWGHCPTGFLAVDIESVLWSHGSCVCVDVCGAGCVCGYGGCVWCGVCVGCMCVVWDVCVGVVGVWCGVCVGCVWDVCSVRCVWVCACMCGVVVCGGEWVGVYGSLHGGMLGCVSMYVVRGVWMCTVCGCVGWWMLYGVCVVCGGCAHHSVCVNVW